MAMKNLQVDALVVAGGIDGGIVEIQSAPGFLWFSKTKPLSPSSKTKSCITRSVFIKMISRLLRLCLLLAVGFLFFGRTDYSVAQETEEPVVHAVLFFSPTCPHCHEAIMNVMIPLMETYEEQLAVVGIDVSLEAGNALYRNAVAYYAVPENRQGVPTLIIEDTVLVSTMEIENEFPGMIAAGLANGGNEWPQFPGMANILLELTPTVTPEVTTTATSAPSPEATTATATGTAVPVAASNDNEAARSLADVDPNAMATEEAAPPPDPAGFLLGWLVVLALLVVLVFSMWQLGGNWSELKQTDVSLKLSTLRSVLMWLLLAAGLIVSGYLAYVETMQVTAVCGPVGECNLVQSSSYARLLGVPIAIWGLLFYLTSAVLWLLQRVESARHLAALALVALTIFGALFSLYLTLLELLVIGAICAWCLTSAVVTGLMLLLGVTGMAKRPLSPDPPWQPEVG